MKLALQETAGTATRPVYLATSRIWDEEHRRRIERHKSERLTGWENREAEKYLSASSVAHRTVVIDCVTLWCTNFFFDLDSNVEEALTQLKEEFLRFTEQDAHFIFVTNEIGLGGVSENQLQRRFTDLQGWMNQFIAAHADEVILMVSGIPLQVKPALSK